MTCILYTWLTRHLFSRFRTFIPELINIMACFTDFVLNLYIFSRYVTFKKRSMLIEIQLMSDTRDGFDRYLIRMFATYEFNVNIYEFSNYVLTHACKGCKQAVIVVWIYQRVNTYTSNQNSIASIMSDSLLRTYS